MKLGLKKLIKDNFAPENAFSDEIEEESLFKKSVDDLLENNVESLSNYGDYVNFALKSKEFPADFITAKEHSKVNFTTRDFFESPSELEASSKEDTIIEGESIIKRKRRKKVKSISRAFEAPHETSDFNSDCSDEIGSSVQHSNELQNTEFERTKKLRLHISEGGKFSSSTNSHSSSDDSRKEEGSEGSELEDHTCSSDNEISSSFIFSKGIRCESSELEKGEAVKRQLTLWEILLEGRIILQKCLIESNKLPKPGIYEKLWFQCSKVNKSDIIECRENLLDLLEKMIIIQDKFRKQCSEYVESNVINVIVDPEKKRRKLMEYPSLLEEIHNQYLPFRNSTIQKWNDRTKIASGKFAKSNFSAFDQPVVKQIEQIMSDRHRLIQRTYLKRSEYSIIGETKFEHVKADENGDSTSSYVSQTDVEIFDDDDFYHKLLRDYIERKTVDISDPTHLGRKWIQLQNLRSKMKRKIDTRRTKGRKINFDVHNKLVNFMTPNTINRWEENGIQELYNSVFGKTFLNI